MCLIRTVLSGRFGSLLFISAGHPDQVLISMEGNEINYNEDYDQQNGI